MELYDVMRYLGGARNFEDREVPDSVLYKVLEAARFAPSGGNRQPWRVVIVRDPGQKRWLGGVYEREWRKYVDQWYGPESELSEERRRKLHEGNRYSASMASVPVFLLVFAEIAALELTDRDLDRPSIVGGGSVYPFVHNIQLALREEGLGARITALMVHEEVAIVDMFGVPEGFALAAVVPVGYPTSVPTRLTRRPVEEFAFVGRYGEAPLRSDNDD